MANTTEKSMREQVAETLATIPNSPPKSMTVYIYDLELYRFYAMFAKIDGRDRSRMIQSAMKHYAQYLISNDPDAKRVWEMAVELGGEE